MSADHQLDNLIRMANQIADNLTVGGGDDVERAAQVASHIRRFWARSMKQLIVEQTRADRRDLNDVAWLAVKQL